MKPLTMLDAPLYFGEWITIYGTDDKGNVGDFTGRVHSIRHEESGNSVVQVGTSWVRTSTASVFTLGSKR